MRLSKPRVQVKPHVEDLSITPLTDRVQLRAGEIVLLNVVDADADREGITRQTLAEVYQFRIANANQRLPGRPRPLNSFCAVPPSPWLTCLEFLFVGWLINRVFRWLEARADRRLKRNLRDIEAGSQRLVHAGRLWLLLAALFRAIRLVRSYLLAYVTLTSVLDLFALDAFHRRRRPPARPGALAGTLGRGGGGQRRAWCSSWFCSLSRGACRT